VATKVEGNGDITEADLTAEGTAAKVEIVAAVRRTLLATKAPASANQKITITPGDGVVIDEGGASATIRIKKDDNIKFSQFVTTNGKDPIVWKLGDIVWTKDEIPYSPNKTSVYTGTVGAASVTITVKPLDEAEAPKITIKPGDGVVIGEGGTTATITRVIGSEINFNELVTTSVTPITWTMGSDSPRVPLKDGIIPNYIGTEQVFTGTVGTMGTGTASVTITVKPPEEAAKPAQFTIKIKKDQLHPTRTDGVRVVSGNNTITKKKTEPLNLNTLVDVTPPNTLVSWTTGMATVVADGKVTDDSDSTRMYTGTVGIIGNDATITINVDPPLPSGSAGGRRKKGSTLRRRVGRILRKTGTRAKR